MSLHDGLPCIQLGAQRMFSGGREGPLQIVTYGDAGGCSVVKAARTRGAERELRNEYAVLQHLEAHGLVDAGAVPAPLALTTAAKLARQVPVLATEYVGAQNCDCLSSQEEETAARKGVEPHFDALQDLSLIHI